MAYYNDRPNLFGTGDRGFGTTWSYGGGDRQPDGDFDPVRPEDRYHASYRGRGPKNYRRSDERIREDVCVRLTEHPDIDAGEIEVSVQNGEVRLTGSVDDRRTKRLAEDVAESVAGVSDVHNELRCSTVRA